MHNSGDVVLATMQYTDSPEVKIRPAVVLFQEFDNVILAGITSNLQMQGISLTKKEGAIKDSVIKINYIFTVSELLIKKRLFTLSKEKKNIVFDELEKRLKALIV